MKPVNWMVFIERHSWLLVELVVLSRGPVISTMVVRPRRHVIGPNSAGKSLAALWRRFIESMALFQYLFAAGGSFAVDDPGRHSR